MSTTFDLAVCIGRFQLLHNGHLELITQALASARRCLLILGSAHAARSPRNPFTWEERAETIRRTLPRESSDRLQLLPLRDLYDMQHWADAVRQAVRAHAGGAGRIALVGHFKGDSSTRPSEFPDWALVDPGRQGNIDASELRAELFSDAPLADALASIAPHVPEASLAFLRAWSRLSHYDALRDEWQAIASDKARWVVSPYPPVFVTVDVVLCASERVLLIRRGAQPGKGRLALPGGFLEQRETIYQSALRELEEETTLSLSEAQAKAALKAVRVFDHPDRSQRGRVITHAHYFVLDGALALPEVRGADDAAEANWVPIAKLADLETEFHDDHFHILDTFLRLTPESKRFGDT